MKPITWENIQKFILNFTQNFTLRTLLKLISAGTWKPILKRILAFILKHIKLLAVLAGIFIALAIGALVFYKRPPVLVVTDAPYIELYGKERLMRQMVSSSLALFRRVRPVVTADGAGADIVVAAISQVARNPYCVLFPGYLAQAAERYHLEFPETHAALLIGYNTTSGLPQSDGVLCVYRTDLEADLYRAGLFAGALGLKKSSAGAQRTCFLLQDRYIQSAEREVFSRGLKESDSEAVARFSNSASDMPAMESISCVVLTRSGAEYLDKNAKIPLILFTWLDPSMLPAETAAVFDDSTWALVVPAARMAASNQAEGKIPSKPLVFSGETADNGIDRILKQLAKKMP
jgi:hypothetical protein